MYGEKNKELKSFCQHNFELMYLPKNSEEKY